MIPALRDAYERARREGWVQWIRQGEGQDADERAMLRGCRFDARRAEHVLGFIQRHGRITEGPLRGRPFELLAWQREYLARKYGWIRPAPEWSKPPYRGWVRRFKWSYLEVPKKNGKTPLLALEGLYLLCGDVAQMNLYSVATSKRQAKLVQGHAVRMIRGDALLSQTCRVVRQDGYDVVYYDPLDNAWALLAADPKTADGVNGSCLADEVHRWTDHEFLNTLRWMLATQAEGLFSTITTAGADLTGPCRVLHDRAKAINAGRQHDDQFLGVIYAAGPDDDPHAEATWRKANPSLGDDDRALLKLPDFRADYEAARGDPSQWREFLQLRLNVWRTAESAWLDIARWDAGEAARRAAGEQRIDCYEGFADEDLLGRPCVLGFDGAVRRDTTAAVFAFGDPADRELIRVRPAYWLPEAAAQQQQHLVPYQAWSEAGLLSLTPGDAVDFDRVYAELLALCLSFRPSKVYYDPLFQSEWLIQKLAAACGAEAVGFPQTIIQFARPTAAAERLILQGKLRHNGHALLTWQLSHCAVRQDCNGNLRPVRQKRGDHRTIDGVVALLMALRDYTTAPEAGPTYYESHDVELL